MKHLWVVGVLGISACVASFEGEESGDHALQANQASFKSCLGGALPGGLTTSGWEHFWNGILAQSGAGHTAQDVLAQSGKSVTIPGKFAYGKMSKDLEGEWVEVWMNNCAGGYKKVGKQKTDSDGRIALKLPGGSFALGEYGIILRVQGDGTTTRSTLRVYPAMTQFLLFDIDATLTTSDSAMWNQAVGEILSGNGEPPEPRPGSIELTNHRFLEQHYEIVYLTSRPYLLAEMSRQWLADEGAAPGTLHVVDDVTDVWPSDSHVGAYKKAFLQSMKKNGFVLAGAYGNATTDIYAYEQANIPKDHTWTVGEHSGASGTVGLGEEYWDHLGDLATEGSVEQPFIR
jgi:phosphatidate phosphatase PAH1